MPDPKLPTVQAPLKMLYLREPETATLTIKAEGYLGTDVSFTISSQKLHLRTALAEGAGGSPGDLCPAELFLGSLAACAGVTMNAVASHLGLNFTSSIVRAEGDLDLRGTMGVDDNIQVGFSEIRLYAKIETKATEEQVGNLLAMTEKYCVVYQSLKGGTKITLERE